LTVVLVLLLSIAPYHCNEVSASPFGPTSTIDIVQVDNSLIWHDGLDNSNGIYVPPGGLDGVVVSNGDVRLEQDRDYGWVASVQITCPEGYQYDFVTLDIDDPGMSTVSLSVLDPAKASTEIGYANETIPPFDKLTATELSIASIDPEKYPAIRLQASFTGNDTNRPRLLSWSLYLIEEHMWFDDLFTASKIVRMEGHNQSFGKVELNLARKGMVEFDMDYPAYPILVCPRYYIDVDTFRVFYPNGARTGYLDVQDVDANGTMAAEFDDIDGDGYLDLVCANAIRNEVIVDSQIYWGRADGVLTSNGATDLATDRSFSIATGDFNGDGEVDIFIGASGDDTHESKVWLNQGDRSFNYDGDIVLTLDHPLYAESADMNSDGYDDILLALKGYSKCFFGGPDGPDTIPDILFPTPYAPWELDIKDINGDGHQDVLFADVVDDRAPVFLGGPDGPDDVPDYRLEVWDGLLWGCTAGDFNADGWTDVVFSGSGKAQIFLGSAAGWNESNVHDINLRRQSSTIEALDLDKDGYDDLIVGTRDRLYIYMGANKLPIDPDVTKAGVMSPHSMAIAIPKHSDLDAYTGMIITEAINLPVDRSWDTVHVGGQVPIGTAVYISILDERMDPIDGYIDIPARSLDLSAFTGHDEIHIRVLTMSPTSTTAPVLDYVSVTWVEDMTWEDRFHGSVRADRVMNMRLGAGGLDRPSGVVGPTLLFANGEDVGEVLSDGVAFSDAGGLDYLANPPIDLEVKGAYDIDMTDVNGDGHHDIAYAVHGTMSNDYAADSLLFLGSGTGWENPPYHRFATVGATAVVMEDLNGDGHTDVVFAQDQDGKTHIHNSTLFWGSEEGWNSTPDVEFVTCGASDVAVVDVNGDQRKDLVFSCYKAISTDTDSLVFVQSPEGFNGSAPTHRLLTMGAKAVVAGDLDGDGATDLVFANGFSAGSVEIDSFIYMGLTTGGFSTTPVRLPTTGASDVDMADLDDDDDLDLIFANRIDGLGNGDVDSFVYLNDGSGGFPGAPDIRLPTMGAMAVMVADLDGTGWADILFACNWNDTDTRSPSLVYLGGGTGYGPRPDVELPTRNAHAIAILGWKAPSTGVYVSEPIVPTDAREMGRFDTVRWTKTSDASTPAVLKLIDDSTWEVLAERTLTFGRNEWSIGEDITIKEHPSIRMVIEIRNVNVPGPRVIDDISINWTKRVKVPPVVVGIEPESPFVLRSRDLSVQISTRDEYDDLSELSLRIEHRRNGTSTWGSYMMSTPSLMEGNWTVLMTPAISEVPGPFDLRVRVTDTDGLATGWVEFPNIVEVRNNLPTAPRVQIDPVRPVTTTTLTANLIESSHDVEKSRLSYSYRWSVDGLLQEDLTTDTVPSERTSKGQNWSVEVFANDGENISMAGVDWTMIHNAAPVVIHDLEDVVLDEDTVHSGEIVLSNAFWDPDGDILEWTVGSEHGNLTVSIDDMSLVRIVPSLNWNGDEEVTFLASDGEFLVPESVMVHVMPVNDVPFFTDVNGQPVESGPVIMEVDQDQPLTVVFGVVDVEGDEMAFEVNSTFIDIDTSTGTFVLTPGNDDVGTIRLMVTVRDVENFDATRSVNITIVVNNVNDPMGDPWILSPEAGSAFKVGEPVQMRATCSDPDTQHGEVLTFSWSSNVSGLLGTGKGLDVSFDEPGEHLIFVRVQDADFEKMVSVNITIMAVVVDPPDDPDDTDPPAFSVGSTNLLILIALAVIVVVGMGYFLVARRKTDDEDSVDELEGASEEERTPEPVPRADLEALSQSIGEIMTQLEDEKASVSTEEGAEVYHETAQAPDPGTAWVPGEDDGVDRERVEEVRMVMTALTQLPRGMPSQLGSWNLEDLAKAVVAGEKRRMPPHDELYVAIDGKYYNADHTNPARFMSEYHEASMEERDPDEVKHALDKQLAEGKIDIETYKKIRELIDE